MPNASKAWTLVIPGALTRAERQPGIGPDSYAAHNLQVTKGAFRWGVTIHRDQHAIGVVGRRMAPRTSSPGKNHLAPFRAVIRLVGVFRLAQAISDEHTQRIESIIAVSHPRLPLVRRKEFIVA